MQKTIRIGTRDSELALWQANTVKNQLQNLGYQTQIVPIKSEGDLVLDKPLYEMGITGVFTKTLDVAMITGKIDIAVHSMKDVPTALPIGIVQKAVLPRASVHDILVYKDTLDVLDGQTIIATGSLRRKAQWLHQFPHHKVVDLRGNVNTRLQKLEENAWQGAIFAAAGLERIGKKPQKHQVLDWMIPAPAQGAMVVVVNQNDTFSSDAVSKLNDPKTEICTHIEREFLRVLEGGCTAPIGAFAQIKNEIISFEGALFSLDGSEKIAVKKEISINNYFHFGKTCALEILENGGKALMDSIFEAMKK
ncbi:hydroxymethylbilane synthase [Capnocytophaga canimorsus]|uniref:hydroxymethylbilane synthase n=1 Tax=Capnocytophaga canimorsus TaxID=28188 RepID=UPI0037D3D0BE